MEVFYEKKRVLFGKKAYGNGRIAYAYNRIADVRQLFHVLRNAAQLRVSAYRIGRALEEKHIDKAIELLLQTE